MIKPLTLAVICGEQSLQSFQVAISLYIFSNVYLHIISVLQCVCYAYKVLLSLISQSANMYFSVCFCFCMFCCVLCF